MNEHSSRSHVLVMLTVTKRTVPVYEPADAMATGAGAIAKARVGKLYLVDLAGSERLKKSLSTGAVPGRPSNTQVGAVVCTALHDAA